MCFQGHGEDNFFNLYRIYMSNNLLTLGILTKEALRLFKNTNSFLRHVEQQYDDSFRLDGRAGGQTINIRLPADYIVTDGPGLSVQDTNQQSTQLTVATQRHVDIAFTSVEQTMDLENFSNLYLAPAVNALIGNVANQIMQGSNGGAANIVANFDGNGNVISPNVTTFSKSRALLAKQSAPLMRTKIVQSFETQANTVGNLSGLLNPVKTISDQYDTGDVKTGLGFEWHADQTILTHTTGSFTAGTVNGAGQSGSNRGMNLVTNPTTGTLNAGDIITITGVNSVNHVTKQSDLILRQFVVTAPVASGATSIPIYPGITPPSTGQAVQYQTVDSSPANGAAINLVLGANVTYKQNLAFAPEAISLATADLVMPTGGVVDVAREVHDNVSLRMLTAYNIPTDQLITRLDILFGYAFFRPEWVCVIADGSYQ